MVCLTIIIAAEVCVSVVLYCKESLNWATKGHDTAYLYCQSKVFLFTKIDYSISVVFLYIYIIYLFITKMSKKALQYAICLYQILFDQSALITEIKIFNVVKRLILSYRCMECTSKTTWDEFYIMLWVPWYPPITTHYLISKPSTHFWVNFAHLTWIYENLWKFMCFPSSNFQDNGWSEHFYGLYAPQYIYVPNIVQNNMVGELRVLYTHII